jgi:hypothetical protein
VAIEDAETPGGEDEKADAGKHDLNEVNGQKAFLSAKTEGDQVHHRRSKENAKENDDTYGEGEEARNDAGYFSGELGFAFGEEPGVNRDERGGEDAFAEQILKEIGNSRCGGKGIGCI